MFVAATCYHALLSLGNMPLLVACVQPSIAIAWPALLLQLVGSFSCTFSCTHMRVAFAFDPTSILANWQGCKQAVHQREQ
jgi:hypothetical protein